MTGRHNVTHRELSRRQWLAQWLTRWLGIALAAATLPARAGDALERQVKAAFLYRFGGFVEWPDGAFARADSPLVIGVFGAEALAGQLERVVAGRTVNGRAVQVLRLDAAPGAGRAAHIAFIGGAGDAAAQGLLDGCRSQPILTVSDNGQVHGMGSVINFLVVDERLRFEVSLKAAAAARLRISARLLAAAYRVQPGAA
jgi:hypothetical protein